MDYLKGLLLVLTVIIMTLIASIHILGASEEQSIIIPDNNRSEIILVQNNSLVGMASHWLEKNEKKYGLIDEIIFRESSNNPKVCNHQYGCSAGMGLAGFIPSTWNSTLDRMTCSNKYSNYYCKPSFLPERCNEKIILPVSEEKHEAIFDGYCNKLVAEWLLKTDGLVHWWDPLGEWGSGPY